MNKWKLLFLSLSPILLGYIFNYSVFIPMIGTILFWVFPFMQILYWFLVGQRLAIHIKSPIFAIAFGNIFGVISLIIYIWEFNILTDVNRNLWLSGFSQMFSCSLSVITSKLAIIFHSNNSSIDQGLMNSVQVIGFLLMIIIFAFGYMHGYRKLYDMRKKASTLL